MTDTRAASLRLHEQLRGKIEVRGKREIQTSRDLSLLYTPGVAQVCEAIAENPARTRDLTLKGNSVAIVTDGSAVLGLGDIGPRAAMPVMEGKAQLFKRFAGIDAWPLCLDTADADAVIETVRRMAPAFGGINLEDIAAPKCFAVERGLQELGIPVFHDDQHGTAIVLLAGLINAAKVIGSDPAEMKVVINGAGAAGTAIARLLRCAGQDPTVCQPVRDVIVCDSRGAIHDGRDDLTPEKRELLDHTNARGRRGPLRDVLTGADVFIGVSRGGLLDGDDVRRMAPSPIVFALANPVPEIMPNAARDAGAAVVATGRSDFPNQINNVLAFPGLFRGALDAEAARIDAEMNLAAAHGLAEAVSAPTPDRIVPDPLDGGVAPRVAQAVSAAIRGRAAV